MYTPRNPPAQWDPQWFAQEQQNIRQAMESAVNGVILTTLYAAPSRIYEGMIVKADGATWNPGAGAGIYARVSSAWTKL
jgi:hypothetical protein